MRNGRYVFVWFVMIGLLIGAGCSEPTLPEVTAVCNPVAHSSPALPVIVESIVYERAKAHGPIVSLHVVGEWIYLGMGDAFAVVDAKGTDDLLVVGWLPLGKYSWLPYQNFSVRDGLVYFTWDEENYTIDVSNPAEPKRVRCTSAVPWPAAEGAFEGQYFISANRSGGITIEERPLGARLPFEVASYTTTTIPELHWQQPPGQVVPLPDLQAGQPMLVRSYTFDDRYLYLLNVLRDIGEDCCGRLTILDLDNPFDPVHVSTIALPSELVPYSLEVAGDRLFVNFYDPLSINHSIGMYDIGNIRRPVEMIAVPGIAQPTVHGEYGYFPGEEDVDIWKLDGPEPELVGEILIPGVTDSIVSQNGGRMVFVGETVYLAGYDRLAVLNNEDGDNPYLVEELAFPTSPVVERFAVGDGRITGVTRDWMLYQMTLGANGDFGKWTEVLEAQWSISMVDVSLSADLVAVLGLELKGPGSFETHLALFDGLGNPVGALSIPDVEGRRIGSAFPYLYVLQTTMDNPVLIVVDFSDLERPKVVDEIGLELAIYQDIAVDGENLYLASTTASGGVSRFDISDGGRPQFVEKLPFDLLATITVGDGYLFGLNVTNQVEVIELRPSGGGVLIGRYDIERWEVDDIAYEDGLLYLALGERGVARAKLVLER